MGHIFFRTFLIIIILSFFLPTFIALPYTPGVSFYYPFWVFLVVIFYPSVILNFGFITSFSFLFLHNIYVVFDFYKSDSYHLDVYFWPFAFSFSVIEYFKESKDIKSFKVVAELSILLILITCITSIISLSIYPEAARHMAGFLSSTGDLELNIFYLLIGIANYSFFHNISFFFPVLLFIFFEKKIKRRYLLIIAVILFIAVIKGAFTSAFGIMVIGLFLSFLIIKIRNILNYIYIVSFIALLFVVYKPYFAIPIYQLADIIDSKFISPKLINVAANLDGSSKFLTSRELMYTESYEKQLDISLDAFGNNIITGSGYQGGHHFWIDLLAKFGILGFIPWILIVGYLILRLRYFKHFRVIYFHTFLLFIFLGMFKPIIVGEMFVFMIFFFPVILTYIENQYFIKRHDTI